MSQCNQANLHAARTSAGQPPLHCARPPWRPWHARTGDTSFLARQLRAVADCIKDTINNDAPGGGRLALLPLPLPPRTEAGWPCARQELRVAASGWSAAAAAAECDMERKARSEGASRRLSETSASAPAAAREDRAQPKPSSLVLL